MGPSGLGGRVNLAAERYRGRWSGYLPGTRTRDRSCRFLAGQRGRGRRWGNLVGKPGEAGARRGESSWTWTAVGRGPGHRDRWERATGGRGRDVNVEWSWTSRRRDQTSGGPNVSGSSKYYKTNQELFLFCPVTYRDLTAVQIAQARFLTTRFGTGHPWPSCKANAVFTPVLRPPI
jgi:hypothetical protein